MRRKKEFIPTAQSIGEVWIKIIKGVFGSIYEKEIEWNQIKRGNDNSNCYFIKLFGSNGKQNHIIYDYLSFYLFYLYKQKSN